MSELAADLRTPGRYINLDERVHSRDALKHTSGLARHKRIGVPVSQPHFDFIVTKSP